jgi:hypothetical protein
MELVSRYCIIIEQGTWFLPSIVGYKVAYTGLHFSYIYSRHDMDKILD